MKLTPPRSLDEIITDGTFIAAGVDRALSARFGEIQRIDVNLGPVDSSTQAHDLPVEATIVARGGSFPAGGKRIALIHGGRWQWLTSAAAGLDVPELQDEYADHQRLRAAARTLVGGKPVVFARHRDGSTAVVAVQASHGPVEARRAVAAGVRMAGGIDEERALTAFAAANGLGVRAEGSTITLEDGTEATLSPGALRGARRITHVSGGAGALKPADVVADAFYTAVEHRLLLDGQFPHARLDVDLTHGKGRITSPDSRAFEVNAHIIATVTHGTWTWAWADQHLAGRAIARASHGLARFGENNGIIDLSRPSIPAAWAREGQLGLMAMPILGAWCLMTTTLNESTTGVVLVDSRELHVPGATPEAAAAVLQAELPEGVDRTRALGAYARFRGLRADSQRLYFPDGVSVLSHPVRIERN